MLKLHHLFKNYSNVDIGLLIIRIVFGFFMVYNHGYGKILGGPERWERLGNALTSIIGFESLQLFFGLMASLSESVFSIFIIFGLLTRISASFLGFTMTIATLKHLMKYELPEMAIIYLTFSFLIFISGPGKYSIDNLILKKFKE
jgi:putative oxidoreductase